MAFKVTNANIDVINKTANVVAIDQSPPQPGQPQPMVQVTFPFDPPPSEARERDRVIATAKQFLQRALNEIA